jgi:hypothetical protein
MTTFSPDVAVLTCHPQICSEAVHRIETHVGWTQSEEIALNYVLKGNIDRLRIPTSRAPRRVDRLWEHTCFEAFVSVKGRPEYYEFNFAPSGEWAAYTFRRYRDGEPLEDEELAPEVTLRGAADSLDVAAIVRVNRLSTMQPRASLRLALSAVIEDNDGTLSYWALKHPPGKPDFHHPDGFALELQRPDVKALNESTVSK